MLPVVIVLNNYFHDLATGVFFGCAVALWGIGRAALRNPEGAPALKPVADTLSRALWIALVWVLVGGVPRTIFFPTYEFIPALGKGLMAELVVKHIILVCAVGFGVFAWWRTMSRLRQIGERGTGTAFAQEVDGDVLESPSGTGRTP